MSHQRFETAREAPPLLALSGEKSLCSIKKRTVRKVQMGVELKNFVKFVDESHRLTFNQ